MDFGLSGRVVLITGASRGIGQILAESFAKAGASLGLLARDRTALEALAAALPTEVVPVPCEVSDDDSVSAAFDRVADRFGGVDSVVVNAGTSPQPHRAHNVTQAEWSRVIDVNLTGAFLTARVAYDYLVGARAGRLVFVSSVMARSPRRGMSPYAASKGGVEALTRALAVDWASDRICVNAVAPGLINAGLGNALTESEQIRNELVRRIPIGRPGEADELANSVLFLSGDTADYITGHVLAVDGGYGLG